MSDITGTKLRERLYIDKVDKETDPPTYLEQVAIENGRPVAVLPADAVPEEERKQAIERAVRGTL